MPLALLLAFPAFSAPNVDMDKLPKVPAEVEGIVPKRGLLSLKVVPPLPPLETPKVRFVGFCPPKALVLAVEAKAPPAGSLVLAPKRGADVLSVEPNILLVLPKAGTLVFCGALVVVAPGAPNADVVLFALLSKADVIARLVETLVMPKVGALVVCVEPNNGVDVLPNMLVLAALKDVEGLVCPKIGAATFPNIADAVVEPLALTLALLANKLLAAVLSVESTLVVTGKIDAAMGELNILVVPVVDVLAPKTA